MRIYFVLRSVVATLTSSKIKYTSELKINANLFCTSLGCCYSDFVEDKIHLGIKNKCEFILYFARLLLSLQMQSYNS